MTDAERKTAWAAWRVALREVVAHVDYIDKLDGFHAKRRHELEQTLTTKDERALFEEWLASPAAAPVVESGDSRAIAHAAWDAARAPQHQTHVDSCYEHDFEAWFARWRAAGHA